MRWRTDYSHLLQISTSTRVGVDVVTVAEGLQKNSFKTVADSLSKTELNHELVEFYKRLKDTGELNNLNLDALNNTRRAEKQILVFNRVPKVGSQTFMELLQRLSVRNNFVFHKDTAQRLETIRLGNGYQRELASAIAVLSTPSVYVKHVCYTNFTKFGLPKPIYINLVRDPIGELFLRAYAEAL